MEREKEPIYRLSDSFNKGLKEKTGSGILEILENGKREGKKALKKAGKIGKTGLVTAGIIGMSLLGTAAEPETTKAYSSESGNLLDQEKITEIRYFQTNFPADQLETQHISGNIETGISTEESDTYPGKYGVENSTKYEISVKGNKEGFPYFHVGRETSEMEIEPESCKNVGETEKISQLSAGAMIDDNGFDKLYGFIKTVEKGARHENSQKISEKTGIVGTGSELIRFMDEGILKLETELGKKIEDSENEYGAMIDLSYFLEGKRLGIGADRSIENQELEDSNQYYIEIGREIEEKEMDIYPEIEIGDLYNSYSIRVEKGLFQRLKAEAGFKNYHQDGETGYYLKAGLDF